MRIEAEEHRLYWKILGVGLVVDLVGAAIIAWGLQKLFEGDDGLLLVTGTVWLAIQFFRFVIMLLNIARLWAAKELGAFNASKETFLQALRVNGLPKPDHYTRSVDAYLSNVADDEDQAPKARVIAACLFGVRAGTKNLGIWHSAYLDSAHEEALKSFAD
jgi:hypothetical protein